MPSFYVCGIRMKGSVMKRVVALIAAALLWMLAPPAHAVDEGVPDGNRHPQVGLLGFDLDGSGPEPAGYWCSGSVLSDRHFLTAAHCITARPADVEWVVSLQPGSPAEPVYRPGVLPSDLLLPLTGSPVRGGVATVHPGFDADRLAHDVAVVTFPAGSFAGVKPIKVAKKGTLDRVRKYRSVRLVAYGSDPERGDGSTTLIFEGYRQTRTTSILRVTKRQVQLKGGLCTGDSGSPQFLGETNVVISVFSTGGDFSTCSGPYVSQRLDTRSERRFLAGFVRLS
jgi:hypothetical protein